MERIFGANIKYHPPCRSDHSPHRPGLKVALCLLQRYPSTRFAEDAEYPSCQNQKNLETSRTGRSQEIQQRRFQRTLVGGEQQAELTPDLTILLSEREQCGLLADITFLGEGRGQDWREEEELEEMVVRLHGCGAASCLTVRLSTELGLRNLTGHSPWAPHPARQPQLPSLLQSISGNTDQSPHLTSPTQSYARLQAIQLNTPITCC